MKDYYSILSLNRNASINDIEVAYKKQVKLYHPDNNKELGDEAKRAFEEKLIEINEAHSVLSNPIKKLDYDRTLSNNIQYKKTTNDSSNDINKTFNRIVLYASVVDWYKKYLKTDINDIKSNNWDFYNDVLINLKNLGTDTSRKLAGFSIFGLLSLLLTAAICFGIFFNSEGFKENVRIRYIDRKNRNSNYKNEWIFDNGKWNYYASDGKLSVNTWIELEGDWYHLDKFGNMEKNTWVDDEYYVGDDGKMLTNSFISSYNNKHYYYVGNDGKKIRDGYARDNGWEFYYGFSGENPIGIPIK